jgi:hypothetical protein
MREKETTNFVIDASGCQISLKEIWLGSEPGVFFYFQLFSLTLPLSYPVQENVTTVRKRFISSGQGDKIEKNTSS